MILESGLWIPEKVGVQAGSIESGANPLYSFHGITVGQFFDNEFSAEQLQAYPDHGKLIEAYVSGEVDTFCIAVDNNHSGRVVTAINALRRLISHYPIEFVGKQHTKVDQHLLVWHEYYEKDIQQVSSQRPALDQVIDKTNQNGWARLFRNDTVQAAVEVAKYKGIVGGMVTAAIASRQAGNGIRGLKSLGRVSPDGNATTFWIFTRPTANDKRKFGESTHAAFTFNVSSDDPGSLYGVTSEIANYGFSMDDIDSHLAHENDQASFFAEIILEGRVKDFAHLIRKLKSKGHNPLVLGAYQDRTDPHTKSVVKMAKDKLPDVVQLEWNGRDGSTIKDGATVLYVRGKDRLGLLRDILKVPYKLRESVVDLSRPLNSGRGFLLTLGNGVKAEPIISMLREDGLEANSYIYNGGKLENHLLLEN
jgi:prephenate dehydratase